MTMKKPTLLLVLTFIAISTLACSTQGLVAATSTPLPTSTNIPTPLPSSTPTLPPPPTAVPTPTPAPIGGTVQYGSLEIRLLKVDTHDLIMPGGIYYYYTKPGQTYMDFAVLVRNNSSQAVQIATKQIYIVEQSGQAWFAGFASSQSMEIGTQFDPFVNLKIPENPITGNEIISFQKDTYLRLIYLVNDDQDILFGIESSPQFTFHVKKK
jgi:hypothetical protein